MTPNPLTTCDLHVHLADSFYAKDLLASPAALPLQQILKSRSFAQKFIEIPVQNIDKRTVLH